MSRQTKNRKKPKMMEGMKMTNEKRYAMAVSTNFGDKWYEIQYMIAASVDEAKEMAKDHVRAQTERGTVIDYVLVVGITNEFDHRRYDISQAIERYIRGN